MAGVSIQFRSNIDSEIAHLKNLPRKWKHKTKREMQNWYDSDFKPYMGRLIRGFKGKDVPAKNAEPYATYKATGTWTDRRGREKQYNIVRTSSHSLGEVGKMWGRYAHAPGQLYRGAMAVKPRISIAGETVKFEAHFDKPFYLPIIHDKLYNQKKAYPFVDAALISKFERLLKRVEDGIVLVWNT